MNEILIPISWGLLIASGILFAVSVILLLKVARYKDMMRKEYQRNRRNVEQYDNMIMDQCKKILLSKDDFYSHFDKQLAAIVLENVKSGKMTSIIKLPSTNPPKGDFV